MSKSKLFLLLAVPVCAIGYPIVIHDRLPDVLRKDQSVQATCVIPTDAGLNRFRLAFYELAKRSSLRERFLRRYPGAADFTAQAFKEFLGMSAFHPALGFDPFAEVEATADPRDPHRPIRGGQARTLLEWIRIGSIYPDLDRRNQDRWYVLNRRRIPFDPVVLNMGSVEGLTGQAHAHYGLNRHPKSDDPEVLKTRPADFAVRVGFPQAPVLTFAPERAQAYADLALIARHLKEPALAAVFAGNGFHYLADASNQIHTLQVGIYEFFRDATIEAWKRKLLTLGGWLGPAPDFKRIGLDIITNHHTWSEEMFRIGFEQGQVRNLFVPDAAGIEAPTLLRMTDLIILAGNKEGPEIYSLVRNMTTGKLREAGVRVDFDGKPDAVVRGYLKAGADPRMVARFFELESKGTRRAATAIAAWWRASGQAGWPLPLDRLIEQQLTEMNEAETRRDTWIRLHAAGAPSKKLQK